MTSPASPTITVAMRLTSSERYTRLAITFHWAIAILVLINIPLGFLHDVIEKATGYSAMWIHKSIGITVLVLSVGRVGWRLAHRPPPLPGHLSRWEAAAAGVTHTTFYVLLLALPLTGWIRSSAGSYPLTWFGLVDIAKLPVEKGSSLAMGGATAHDLLSWLMAALVALHLAAVLRHRLVLGDAVLARMLP